MLAAATPSDEKFESHVTVTPPSSSEAENTDKSPETAKADQAEDQPSVAVVEDESSKSVEKPPIDTGIAQTAQEVETSAPKVEPKVQNSSPNPKIKFILIEYRFMLLEF